MEILIISMACVLFRLILSDFVFLFEPIPVDKKMRSSLFNKAKSGWTLSQSEKEFT